MRIWIAGILALAFDGGAATAADLTGQMVPPASAAPVDWSGVYVGASIGHGWLRDTDYSFTPPLRSSGEDVIVGGHLGYLYQVGSLVFGAESEVTRLGINFEGFPIDAENMFVVKARGGFGIDRFLLGGHVGAAYATTNISLEDWGWIAGAQVDYLITDNLVAGVSYDHVRFEEFDGTLIDARLNLVKARLSLKF